MTMAPILSSAPFSPAARDDAEARADEAEEARLPEELAARDTEEPDMDMEEPDMEALDAREVDTAEEADARALERDEPEGSAVLPVAEESLTLTEPDATTPWQRAA